MTLCSQKSSQELEQKKAVEDKKKHEEEEKAKELELKEAEEKAKSNPELLEVKRRLGKLEEAVNEIVEKKHPVKSEASDTQSASESSSSVAKDHVNRPKSGEPTTEKTKKERHSEDSKR